MESKLIKIKAKWVESEIDIKVAIPWCSHDKLWQTTNGPREVLIMVWSDRLWLLHCVGWGGPLPLLANSAVSATSHNRKWETLDPDIDPQLTLNMLNCFKSLLGCIHISYHILDFVQHKNSHRSKPTYCLYNNANTMPAGALATWGARASAGMVLTK